MTAHHGQPVPISGTGSSSQAGVASFHYLRAEQPAPIPRHRPCPKCGGSLVYWRRGDDPWGYCTSPNCDFEMNG